MISNVIDGFVPSLFKSRTINGYASSTRDGIQFMDLGKTMIRYRVAGNKGPVIVFQTDPPVVIEHYDYLVQVLSKDYRVVVFETPGFGFSIPSIRLDYSYRTSVELTEQFIERLRVGAVTLVAPCVLGYSGIGVAERRPDLVNRLVLSQVPSWDEMLKWKAERDPKGLLSKPVLSQLLLKVLKTKRTPVWFEVALGKKELVKDFNKIAQLAYKHGATFNLASGFQQLLIGKSPLPSNIRAKTLFLWGDRDISHCHTCKHSSLMMVPTANVVHLPNAGHFPELEETDVVIGHLENFVHCLGGN